MPLVDYDDSGTDSSASEKDDEYSLIKDKIIGGEMTLDLAVGSSDESSADEAPVKITRTSASGILSNPFVESVESSEFLVFETPYHKETTEKRTLLERHVQLTDMEKAR
ncbi:unnamed protein product [Protopolystoma xenopodis]|uniref:Uncharacterized protein n=1 Tax=Protopolystoma xenopodis TaxID=117903 RepID=A0A448X453_9PLAT|nr:unnamed protein product [Protopolystoma xenopodis]